MTVSIGSGRVTQNGPMDNSVRTTDADLKSSPLLHYRERTCADTIGTVPVL